MSEKRTSHSFPPLDPPDEISLVDLFFRSSSLQVLLPGAGLPPLPLSFFPVKGQLTLWKRSFRGLLPISFEGLPIARPRAAGSVNVLSNDTDHDSPHSGNPTCSQPKQGTPIEKCIKLMEKINGILKSGYRGCQGRKPSSLGKTNCNVCNFWKRVLAVSGLCAI